MSLTDSVSRRKFLKSSALFLGAAAVPLVGSRRAAAAVATPQLEQGLQIGDVVADRAVIWSRSDRPARLVVDYDVNPSFSNAMRVRGPFALETTDYTARVDLTELPSDSDIHVRVVFQDLSNDRVVGTRSLVTSNGAHKNRRMPMWSGDTAGQGWGINPEFGGMKIYEAMRQTHPDFFIHSGDNIYADGPIQEFANAEDGKVWHNIVIPEVSKVAETLAEFRGRYKYNLLDENVRRFNAEVPQIWQWDDHEVVNNWSDSKDLTGDVR
jgi:alkaline phosphatase D